MRAPGWSEVSSLLEQAAGPGRVAPSVSLLVGRGDDIVFEHAAGFAGPPSQQHPSNAATIYDLASLTKPLVTVALALDLIARGKLSLDTRVADVLSTFAPASGDARRATISVRDLLRHDSGLPAHKRYYESFDPSGPASTSDARARRERMFALAVAEPLERDPRAGSLYSDIGFLVLGAVVEAAGGDRVERLAASVLLEPLEVGDATYVDVLAGPTPELAARCVTTGHCEWRGSLVHGTVHDQNACVMGGIAPHAGLFASARAVHRLVAEWVAAYAGRGRVLDPRLVGHSWDRSACAAAAAPSTWALGWDTPTPGASSAGTRVGAGAVGHLGYTGTSIWIDPSRRAHVVLLTNRVACGRSPDAIRALRPRVHDAVFAALGTGPYSR